MGDKGVGTKRGGGRHWKRREQELREKGAGT